MIDINGINSVHLKIVGPTNTGKTVTAKALIGMRLRLGHEIIIFDPHDDGNTWNGAKVHGTGRDYAQIVGGFVWLLEVLNERYRQRARGKQFRPMTIVIDEVPAIAAHTKLVRPVLGAIGREGRKVGMHLIILTQSTRVTTLAIEGEADMLENFGTLELNGPGELATFRTPNNYETVDTTDWLTLASSWQFRQVTSTTNTWVLLPGFAAIVVILLSILGGFA